MSLRMTTLAGWSLSSSYRERVPMLLAAGGGCSVPLPFEEELRLQLAQQSPPDVNFEIHFWRMRTVNFPDGIQMRFQTSACQSTPYRFEVRPVVFVAEI